MAAAMPASPHTPASALRELPVLQRLADGRTPCSASPLLLGAATAAVDHYWGAASLPYPPPFPPL